MPPPFSHNVIAYDKVMFINNNNNGCSNSIGKYPVVYTELGTNKLLFSPPETTRLNSFEKIASF